MIDSIELSQISNFKILSRVTSTHLTMSRAQSLNYLTHRTVLARACGAKKSEMCNRGNLHRREKERHNEMAS